MTGLGTYPGIPVFRVFIFILFLAVRVEDLAQVVKHLASVRP
jgi:hypothetical protein